VTSALGLGESVVDIVFGPTGRSEHVGGARPTHVGGLPLLSDWARPPVAVAAAGDR